MGDGAISPEQVVKLRQCLIHIDELEHHKNKIDWEIFRLSNWHEVALSLIRTVSDFNTTTLTAVQVLSKIAPDMSSPQPKTSSHRRYNPCNDQGNFKIEST